MTAVAADEGIAFRFDVARPGNTFDAHRLAHLAAMQGVQHQLQERLLAATFSEGQAVGDHDVLVGLATDVGIDADEVARMLASDDYAEAVRTDEQVAVDLGITAVPFFVVDRATGSVAPNPPRRCVPFSSEAGPTSTSPAWPRGAASRPVAMATPATSARPDRRGCLIAGRDAPRRRATRRCAFGVAPKPQATILRAAVSLAYVGRRSGQRRSE